MPANDEGKLIAYKWRKSAILETPEQIFLPGRNSRCTFSQTPPHPYMGKIGQIDTASRKFFQHADRHRRFLPSPLNVQIRAFWKPISKIFC